MSMSMGMSMGMGMGMGMNHWRVAGADLPPLGPRLLLAGHYAVSCVRSIWDQPGIGQAHCGPRAVGRARCK